MSSLTFGKNEKGSYILCNRNEIGCEIGKFASRMYNSCQKCEKKGCFICKAYFFVLSQLEESESDLQYQYSNDCLSRISTETNEFKFELEKV